MQTDDTKHDDDGGSVTAFRPKLESLGNRLKAARKLLDIKQQIADHPWYAVGAAAVSGAWVALEMPRRKSGEPSWVAGAVASTAGAIALRIFREVALRQASAAVKDWYDAAVLHQAATINNGRTKH
jgi:hypothetical protein